MDRTPERDIRAVLDESGPDYESFEFEPATGGTRADVYLVTLTYRGEVYDVVVKFRPPGGSRFAVEPRLHEYVAERTDVPVPRILVFRSEPERDVPPYFVTERVEGTNLSDTLGDLSADDWERVVEQVGRIVGDLHAEVAFETFGRLTLRDDRLTIRNWRGNWRDYFADLTRSRIGLLADTPFESVQPEAREAFEASLDAVPEEGVPRLVHDDLTPTNLLYDRDREAPLTAVLDWQDTLAAHPDYQLAQVEFLYLDSMFGDPTARDRLREHLLDGYRANHRFERGDTYDRSRPVYQFSTLLWRMSGFEAAFAEDDLARGRAEFQYRQQFDRLLDELPR